MHDDRVVVVDEQGLDRRLQRRARCRWRPTSTMLRVRVPGGTRSGRASFAGVLGNANAAPLTSPPPGTAELAGQRGQREHRADAAAAVLVALEPVAHADRRPARCVCVPLGERATSAAGQPARLGRPLDRPRPRQRHELLEAAHPPLDERAVERAAPLELGGHRPRQHHVGARAQRQVQIGLLGDLGAARDRPPPAWRRRGAPR